MFSAKVKNMILSVVMLCALAAFSGLILGFLNKITYVDPNTESFKKYAKLAKTDRQFTMQAENIGDILLFAKTSGDDPYYAFTVRSIAGYDGERFEVYIIIKDDKIIAIDENSERQTYLDQVKALYTLYYDADLGAINSFGQQFLSSGATFTSTAIRTAVNSALSYYKEYTQAPPVVDALEEALKKFGELSGFDGEFKIRLQNKDNLFVYATADAYFAYAISAFSEFKNKSFYVYIIIKEDKIIAIDDNSVDQSHMQSIKDAVLDKYYALDLSGEFELDGEYLVSGSTKTSAALRDAVDVALSHYKKMMSKGLTLELFAQLAQTDKEFTEQAENIGSINLFATTDGENPYFAFSIKSAPAYKGEIFDIYIIIKDDKILAIDDNSNLQSWKGQLAPLYAEYYELDLSGEVEFNILTTGATSTSKAVRGALETAVNYYKDYMQPAVLDKFAQLANIEQTFVTQARNSGDIKLFAKTDGENTYYAFSIKSIPAYKGEIFDVYIIIYNDKIMAIDDNSNLQSWKTQLAPLYAEYHELDLSGEVEFNVLTTGATSTSKAVRGALETAVSYYKAYIQGAD